MANITLNIEGDLNIYVSEEDGQPDSLYLDGMDGCPETLRIHLEADGKDDESKAEVIYAIPGAAAISMTLYEALSLELNSGGADSLELMPVSGIFIAFNSDDVIIDQSGDCYVFMLNQASGDRQILAKQLNISPHQLSYVTHSGEGEGLLFYGSTILPFVDRFPKDTELYRIITTKPQEQAG